MEFITNKSKKELLDVIQHIQALISDDTEYTYLGNMEYEAYYQNRINTEELAKLVEKLWEVYKLSDDAYYKKGV